MLLLLLVILVLLQIGKQCIILLKITYCLPVWSKSGKSAKNARDIVLLRAAHVLQHNENAILNTSTYTVTGLLPFFYYVSNQMFVSTLF